MSPVLAARELRSYLRAWERHHVRFGVVCSRPRLALCHSVFSSACVDVPVDEIPAIGGSQDTPFAVAVADDVLVYRFPYGHANARLRGERNAHFLDAAKLQQGFLPLQNSPAKRIPAVILPIAHVYPTERLDFNNFLGRLTGFLDTLVHGSDNSGCCGPGRLRYAVELHNSEYLLPEYFSSLERYGVTHVLNTTATMPSLLEQIQLPHVLTTDRVIVRTAAGGDSEWLLGIMETVRRCVSEKKELYVYFSEGEDFRTESTLKTLMNMLSSDLAKLSPIRRNAA